MKRLGSGSKTASLSKFHQERLTCIGGSDVHHLMALEPYGCPRRLFYDKRHSRLRKKPIPVVVADYPFDGNVHTRRGSYLEPVAALRYAEEAGAAVRTVPHVRRPGFPFMAAHIDRLQNRPDHAELGALELKVPTVGNWYKIRQGGPSPMWDLQVQWEMGCARLDWGTIAVMNPETLAVAWFDRVFDVGMFDDMTTIASDFWAQVDAADEALAGADHNPLPKLAPGDKRCLSCPYRKRCMGIGDVAQALLDAEQVDTQVSEFVAAEELAQLLADRLAAHEEVREATKRKEEYDKQIKAALAARPGIPGIKTSTGMAWQTTYTKHLKAQPERDQQVTNLIVRPAKPEAEEL